jgi:elongation factor G
MRCPTLARLPHRALSGLTRSPVRLQSQNFLYQRCVSTAALRSPIAGQAYQSVFNRYNLQRRNASAATAAAVYVFPLLIIGFPLELLECILCLLFNR